MFSQNCCKLFNERIHTIDLYVFLSKSWYFHKELHFPHLLSFKICNSHSSLLNFFRNSHFQREILAVLLQNPVHLFNP